MIRKAKEHFKTGGVRRNMAKVQAKLDEFDAKVARILMQHPELRSMFSHETCYITVVAAQFKKYAREYLNGTDVSEHHDLIEAFSNKDYKDWRAMNYTWSRDFNRKTFLAQYGKALCLKSDWKREFFKDRPYDLEFVDKFEDLLSNL